MADLSSLPPPPKGQQGVTLQSLQHLPDPPQGQTGMTLDQIKSMGGGTTGAPTQTQPSTGVNIGPPSLFGPSDIWNYIKGVGSSIASLPGKLQQDMKQGQDSANKGGVGNFIKGAAQTGLRSAGDIAGTAMSPVTQAVGQVMDKTGATNAINTVAQKIAEPISNIPAVQKFATSHPNAGQDFERVLNIVTLADGARDVSPETVIEKIKSLPTDVKDSLKTKYVNDIANNYRDVAGQTKTAGKVLAKSESLGKDPSQFLAERNIIPKVEDGKIRTTDAQATIQKQVTPLNEHLDIALKTLEPSIPKISIDTLQSKVSDIVNGLKNITETTRQEIMKGVTKEINLQKNAKGDSLGITQVQDIKKSSWADTKFDSTKPVKTDINYTIGKAAQGIIENAVPKDAFGVQELNKYIGDHYDANKFLQSIEGNTVKGGRLGKYFTRAIGTTIGVPFGPLGEIGGFLGGEAVSNILQDTTFSNPFKQMILNDLKVKDPIAYKQALDFIKKANLEKEMRLKLPAPTTQYVGPTQAGASYTPNTAGFTTSPVVETKSTPTQ